MVQIDTNSFERCGACVPEACTSVDSLLCNRVAATILAFAGEDMSERGIAEDMDRMLVFALQRHQEDRRSIGCSLSVEEVHDQSMTLWEEEMAAIEQKNQPDN